MSKLVHLENFNEDAEYVQFTEEATLVNIRILTDMFPSLLRFLLLLLFLLMLCLPPLTGSIGAAGYTPRGVAQARAVFISES
jgi:hypothetical protein